MKHLDFTIDFETCSLGADAAPMQVAVVPWLRDNREDPFTMDEDGTVTEEQTKDWPEPYVGHVDLRSCVVEGFDFDPDTIRWWAGRSEAAKDAVCEGLAEPVEDITIAILDYIRNTAKELHTESVCLWAQGADFDISIIRSLCRRYDVDLESIIPHTSFRDCRTVILEGAIARRKRDEAQASRELLKNGMLTEKVLVDEDGNIEPLCSPQSILADPSKAYTIFPPLPDEYARGSEAHDALYDATRSSWYTWQALKSLRQ